MSDEDAPAPVGVFICTRGRRNRRCVVQGCGGPATLLCDGPGEGGTSDAPLCPRHASRVGTDRDLCPSCAGAAGDPKMGLVAVLCAVCLAGAGPPVCRNARGMPQTGIHGRRARAARTRAKLAK